MSADYSFEAWRSHCPLKLIFISSSHVRESLKSALAIYTMYRNPSQYSQIHYYDQFPSTLTAFLFGKSQNHHVDCQDAQFLRSSPNINTWSRQLFHFRLINGVWRRGPPCHDTTVKVEFGTPTTSPRVGNPLNHNWDLKVGTCIMRIDRASKIMIE